MNDDSPILDALIHRLAECPAEFQEKPRIGNHGVVHVDAVVSDLLEDLGGQPLEEKLAKQFRARSNDERNKFGIVLLACWLLADEVFRRDGRHADAVLKLLSSGFDDLAALVSAELFVTDPDRREELVRVVLGALAMRPAGESRKVATDRLASLNSVERARVLRDTREKQRRARELREKMRQQQAQEAAARWGRE